MQVARRRSLLHLSAGSARRRAAEVTMTSQSVKPEFRYFVAG
jgi:hypothetical protein